MRLAIILAALQANIAMSQNIGLKPTLYSLGRAEAITATATGTDALFYNPAGLAWNNVATRLIGIEQLGDRTSLDRMNEILESDTPEDSLRLPVLFDRLNSAEAIYARTTIRAIDVVLPHFAVSTFADLQLQYKNSEVGGARSHQMAAQVDIGGIAGIGIRAGWFGFGVAYYRMGRASVTSNPNTEQRDTVIAAIANGSLAEDTVPFRDFTKFDYGGTEGYNLGIQIKPNPKKIDGIGIAVLNVGGSKFSRDIRFDDPELDKIEDQLTEEIERYELTFDTPDDIAEMLNVGLSYGLTEQDSAFEWSFNLDANDLTGEHIDHKYALTTRIGLTLPDELAMATAVPVLSLDENRHVNIHMGLLGLYAFAGYRPGEYTSAGATVAMHAGLNEVVSVLKLELTTMTVKPEKDNHEVIEISGLMYMAGLTFIL